jgi:hypothetical protein
MSKTDKDNDILDSPILQFVGKILIVSSIMFFIVYFLVVILGAIIWMGL